MPYPAVIAFANTVKELPIDLDVVQRWLLERDLVASIEVHLVKALDPRVLRGIYREVHWDRQAVYGEPEACATILCSIDLPEEWRQLVVCKELVHVLDQAAQKTATAADAQQLIADLATPPLPDGNNGPLNPEQFKAEKIAVTVALMILVPHDAARQIQPLYSEDRITDHEVSLAFGIPEQHVPFVMSERFLAASATMLRLQREAQDR
jgi:hypothetical protein